MCSRPGNSETKIRNGNKLHIQKIYVKKKLFLLFGDPGHSKISRNPRNARKLFYCKNFIFAIFVFCIRMQAIF